MKWFYTWNDFHLHIRIYPCPHTREKKFNRGQINFSMHQSRENLMNFIDYRLISPFPLLSPFFFFIFPNTQFIRWRRRSVFGAVLLKSWRGNPNSSIFSFSRRQGKNGKPLNSTVHDIANIMFFENQQHMYNSFIRTCVLKPPRVISLKEKTVAPGYYC